MPTTTKLQASLCYNVGVRAKAGKKYTLAVEWLREAKQQATMEGKMAYIPAINAELVETIKNVRQLALQKPISMSKNIQILHVIPA